MRECRAGGRLGQRPRQAMLLLRLCEMGPPSTLSARLPAPLPRPRAFAHAVSSAWYTSLIFHGCFLVITQAFP